MRGLALDFWHMAGGKLCPSHKKGQTPLFLPEKGQPSEKNRPFPGKSLTRKEAVFHVLIYMGAFPAQRTWGMD